MDNNSSPDYKALFLQEKAFRRQAEEERQRAEEERERAEEEREQERKGREQERKGREQAEERNRQTTFQEFIRHCHNLLSRPLKVEAPSRSTTGSIPPPTGKYCPTRLCLWEDCPVRQQEIYDAVRSYLQPAVAGAPQLFASIIALEDHSRRFARRPISSEQDLESYERLAVEDHVHDIIEELCKLPNARDEFRLGHGVRFDNHANALDEIQGAGSAPRDPPSSRPSRPDQFCIHRVDGNTSTLLTTVEYKPPHKLSVENLRAGLRPMEFWEKVVKPETIPTGEAEKLKYNAERLAGSVIVQEYHVMIQEGLEYSYVTNGLALVLLRVDSHDPSTLYYYLFEPNMDVDAEDDQDFQHPKTAIARVLCLCLMSFRSTPRSQEWRLDAQSKLHTWETSFAYTYSQISEDELQRTPPGSEYIPSSSPVGSPRRRVRTRSRISCAPSGVNDQSEWTDSSDCDSNQATGRKRGFSQVSQVTSSPPTQQSTRPTHSTNSQGNNQPREHVNRFCTQRCLLGLQQGGLLDDRCPNVKLHQQGLHSSRHHISGKDFIQMLKQQLDDNIDRCVPMGGCGAYGAPFKLTCAVYGYTVIGKGTTSWLWKEEVKREAEIYHVLRRAQGSAVPVFLGTIDLAKIYFLHGAGEIRHMLVMGWGGENTAKLEKTAELQREISRSEKEIRSLGVVHRDLRLDNILWNPELERALIIDLHRSDLDRRPMEKRTRSLKRPSCRTEVLETKRLRVV